MVGKTKLHKEKEYIFIFSFQILRNPSEMSALNCTLLHYKMLDSFPEIVTCDITFKIFFFTFILRVATLHFASNVCCVYEQNNPWIHSNTSDTKLCKMSVPKKCPLVDPQTSLERNW